MTMHHLTLPVRTEDIADIKVGDIVYLSGVLTGTGGLPTHKRIIEYLDAGRELPLLIDSTFLHLPHMVEEVPGSQDYTIHYVNPTTSMRFDALMPRLVKDLGLKITGGKGGLGPQSVAAMKQAGCIYVSLLGGGSPILSAAIREVLDVTWRDLPSHFRLSRLCVEDLGPLTVGIDMHGNSVYAMLADQARDRMPGVYAQLQRRRHEAGLP